MFKRKNKAVYHITAVDLILCKGYDIGIACETEAQARFICAAYNDNNKDVTIKYDFYKGA